MADSAIDRDAEKPFPHSTMACETVCVMRLYFHRSEIIVDKTAPIFRRRKSFKNAILESARKFGISRTFYFESVSGYQPIESEFCDSHSRGAISIIDIIDRTDRIERFCAINAALLSGHMIVYEEKQLLAV